MGALFFVVVFVFWIWCLFDCISTEASQHRNLPKIAWVIIVVLLGALGGLAWVLLGRPQGTRTRGWRPDIVNPRPPASARPPRRSIRPPAPAPEPPRPEITDRRSAELDRQLEAWEREQARKRERSDHGES
jgi:hypothetical protein